MKKTQTVNLGGVIFHINLDAYDRLLDYLEAIKKQFSGTEGQEEIIEDIESRISEIFQEKNIKIITASHVDDVIQVMGKPEDYLTDESPREPEKPPRSERAGKRMYRHPDDKILGGVCGGLGAYFGIDPVLFRLGFVLTLFMGGLGLLLYLVLWLIVPKAESPSERLKMAGKPVTADAIGKAVEEKMSKALSSETNGNVIKTFFRGVGRAVEALFGLLKRTLSILGVILRPLVGIVFIVFGFALTLISVVFFLGIRGHFGIFEFGDENELIYVAESLISSLPGSDFWVFPGIIVFLGIPIFALIYFGLQLLFRLAKQPGYVKGILGSLWIMSLVSIIIFGVMSSTSFSRTGEEIRTVLLEEVTADTVHIKLIENKEFHWTERETRIVKTKGNRAKRVSSVNLDIKPSRDKNFHLVIQKEALGQYSKEARLFAENIGYNYIPESGTVSLNNFLKIRNNDPYKFQRVRLVLLVPLNKSVYLDETLKYFIYDVDNVTDTYDRHMVDHTWMMKEEGLTCTDCN